MIVELIPLALLGGVLGLDVVSFPQAMISRPIVAATLAGGLMGQAPSGMLIGAALELRQTRRVVEPGHIDRLGRASGVSGC